jgi:hypothetical protein
MKERILKGWTFTRVLYVFMGVFIIIQSISVSQWPMTLFGAYFASMGLFAFGCASGNCFGGTCSTEPLKQAEKKEMDEVEYEEIKKE